MLQKQTKDIIDRCAQTEIDLDTITNQKADLSMFTEFRDRIEDNQKTMKEDIDRQVCLTTTCCNYMEKYIPLSI